MVTTARRWYLAKHANAEIEPDTFEFREEPIAALNDGEMLVRSI